MIGRYRQFFSEESLWADSNFFDISFVLLRDRARLHRE